MAKHTATVTMEGE